MEEVIHYLRKEVIGVPGRIEEKLKHERQECAATNQHVLQLTTRSKQATPLALVHHYP